MLHHGFGLAVDQIVCGGLALLHRRHAQRVSPREAAEEYFAQCERQTRAEHFALPPALENLREETPNVISWQSRAVSNSQFPRNARVQVVLSTVEAKAPTVVMLHALMSASAAGYRFWARRFNSLGWNTAFVHLPFHYSRRPAGYWNGELCCTADLILTGDTLRQAVVEVRQLLDWLRARGSTAVGLLATSYGGWVGALVALLEPRLRFVVLLAPMVNTSYALYEGPTSWTIRRQLARAGLMPELVERHAHLSSPLHSSPAIEVTQHTLIVGGQFDRIVRLSDLRALHQAWPGSELATLPQAHFGYGMIPRGVAWLRERDLLATDGRPFDFSIAAAH